ncbi:MAG: PorV/PorQ family protein [bacterium]|nr:PorV/PorQ family protein [bacterium]
MKRIIVLLSLLIVTNNVAAKSPGKTGATFLKLGVGAKPVAMGGAFCALADESSAIYWNPAGLAFLKDKELSFTHIAWFEDINYEYLTYLQPLQELGIKMPGVFAGNLSYLSVDDIKKYDVNKNYSGTFKAQDLLFNLSYAGLIKPWMSSGLNLKYINQKITSSSTGLVFDIGFLSKTPLKNFTTGLVFQNVNLFNNFMDELPFNIKLGCGYKPINILTLGLDMNLPNDSDPKFHLGAEYLYPEIEGYEIALRAGIKTGVDTGKFNLGFGIKTGKYRFDYAYSSYDDLGDTHQLSFNLIFAHKSDKSNMSYSPENKPEEVKAEPKAEKEAEKENEYYSTKAKVNLWR